MGKIIIRVMTGYLLSMSKKEIKNKTNDDKITFTFLKN
jgi:hypothetical protein